MTERQLGKQQKKVLELLTTFPNSTILEVGKLVHGKQIIPGSTEYNSVCRSLNLLADRGLVEKEVGTIKWHIKGKTH